jgi:hypothetical protein
MTLRSAFIALQSLLISIGFAGVQAPIADDIVAKAAAAVGPNSGNWVATGTSDLHHAKGGFTLRFDANGCYRTDQTGELPQSEGFDGKTCWTDGPSLVPHPVSLFGRQVSLISSWVISGQWTDRKLPLTRTLKNANANQIELELSMKEGGVPVILLLDPTTFLPKSISYESSSGRESWIFDRFQKWGTRTIPALFRHRSGTQDDTVEITDAKESASATDFRMPPSPVSSESFPPGGLDIPVKRVSGYTFVRPTINGKDLGWFFLDTGADVMCIDPKLAASAGMREVGNDTTAGVVGVTTLKICKAATFRLGPVQIDSPVFAELPELGSIGALLNLPIGGICGYDFICRTGLDIDPGKETIHCFQPGAPATAAAWEHIVFGSNTPVLECSFAPGGTGEFSIDTGSDSTVDFFSAAVSKYHLLDRSTGSQLSGGAGGTAESKRGAVDWFELGKKRFESPQVIFQTTQKGLFGTSFYTGNVGAGFLSKFRLLLDYPDQQIGFAEPAKS